MNTEKDRTRTIWQSFFNTMRYVFVIPIALLFSSIVLLISSYLISTFTVGMDYMWWARYAPTYEEKLITGTIFTLLVYPATVASFFRSVTVIAPKYKAEIIEIIATIFLIVFLVKTILSISSLIEDGNSFAFIYKIIVEVIAIVSPTLLFLISNIRQSRLLN